MKTSLRSQLSALAVTAILAGMPSLRAQATYNTAYEGTAGIWEKDLDWTTGAYPNNGHTITINNVVYPGENPVYNVGINVPIPITLGRFVRVQTVNIAGGSTLHLAPNGYLWANLWLTDSGVITLDGTDAGGGTVIRVAENMTVINGGIIHMSDTYRNAITAGAPGQTLTIDLGGTIRGSGYLNAYLGDDVRTYFRIVNHGLIEAMQPSNPLTIQLWDDSGAPNQMLSDGILRASDHGVLTIAAPFTNGGLLQNQGTIEALNNAIVRLGVKATIQGGLFATAGSGTIECVGGTVRDVTSNAKFVIPSNGSGHLYLAGTFANNGTLLVNGTENGGNAWLRIIDGATITGPGVVQLTRAANGNTAVLTGGAGGVNDLTFSSNATVQGSGFIGDTYYGEGALRVTNQGLIHANEAANSITIQAFASNDTQFTNAGGTLRASNGGTLYFLGVSTIANNGGTMQAAPNSTISGQGGQFLAQSSGTIDLNDGTFDFPSGLDLNGGQLIGSGTFKGPIRNNGGTVAPGHSPGLMTVNGDYTQGANGVLNLEIGGTTAGTEYDQLKVNGTAALGGTLNISLINGFRPAVGDVFQLIVPNSITGSFAAINTIGFTANATNSNGALTLTVTSVPDIPLNISTRMQVDNDPNQLIGGFIVTGSEPKKVIILATGPSLAQFGIPGVLADPVLQLFQGNTMLASNDNWKVPNEAEIQSTGLQPTHDLESAIVRTLDPGAYTAVVRGTNGTGIGTVQVYDLSQASKSKLANISSRGLVQATDSGAMIAGFIIGGNGGANSQVVVRALGPSLSAFGIAGALPDPTLDLKNANGATVISNDDWQQSQGTEINATGLAPSNAQESALMTALPSGSFTAIVRGKNGATGVAVVEVYNVN